MNHCTLHLFADPLTFFLQLLILVSTFVVDTWSLQLFADPLSL